MRFTGIEGLTLDASIIHSNVEADGNTNAYFGTGTEDRIIETITPESYEDEFLLVNITAEIDIAGMTLVSSTGYIDREMELRPTGNFENLIGNNLPLRQRVTLNATVFFIDWTDVQSQFALDCGYYYRVNEGTVHSAGIELETAFLITENWMVGLNSSYTDAEAQDDVFSPGAFGPPGVVALDGQKAPLFLITGFEQRCIQLPPVRR